MYFVHAVCRTNCALILHRKYLYIYNIILNFTVKNAYRAIRVAVISSSESLPTLLGSDGLDIIYTNPPYKYENCTYVSKSRRDAVSTASEFDLEIISPVFVRKRSARTLFENPNNFGGGGRGHRYLRFNN